MALSIQIKDAQFVNKIGSLTLPDRTGLVAEYIFGKDAATSTINFAGTGGNLTVVGTPVFGDGYAEIKSGSGYGDVGFDTGLTVPSNATMIVVAKNTTLCPGYFKTSANFTGFMNYQYTPSIYNAQSGTLANVANLPLPTHSDFAFYAGLMPLADFGEIYIYEDGAPSVAIAETAGGNKSGSPLSIGTTTPSSGNGVANIAYAAMFDRVLTAQEIEDAYLSLKAFLATRDVIVS